MQSYYIQSVDKDKRYILNEGRMKKNIINTSKTDVYRLVYST